MTRFSAVILAAGKGTRMKSDLPKPLHLVAGKPMLAYVIEACEAAGATEIVVVIAPDDTRTPSLFPKIKTAVQQEQKGTGHATQVGVDALGKPVDKIISMLGDMPFIQPETIKKLAETDNAVTVLAMQPKNPKRYGRLVVKDDVLEKIVEFKDATDTEKKINLCNSGTIAVCGKKAKELLAAIKTNNAAGEYYMTDIVGIARERGERCGVSIAPYEETAAANTREELAFLEKLAQKKMRSAMMEKGVTLNDPDTVYFHHDTIVGKDTIIEPNVFFGPNTVIQDNVTIKAFSHIEGATIRSGASVGPFARLRPETLVGQNAKIGNFVEIKKSLIGDGTKIGHLTYIGDSDIGKQVNIGAGTVTCNYDGFDKHQTKIGDGAFIGSDTIIVAPVQIGGGAFTGAGSVITENVAGDSLAVARSKQFEKPGWAKLFRMTRKTKH